MAETTALKTDTHMGRNDTSWAGTVNFKSMLKGLTENLGNACTHMHMQTCVHPQAHTNANMHTCTDMHTQMQSWAHMHRHTKLEIIGISKRRG